MTEGMIHIHSPSMYSYTSISLVLCTPSTNPPVCLGYFQTPRAQTLAVTMPPCHRSCHRPLTWPWQVCVQWLLLAVPRQLYLRCQWTDVSFWNELTGVPRLAVLPGSCHSNPLFHFSGLSFWHSEKHHLKLIKAPYFAPNLTATHSVYYVLCRVGGTSQGVLG